MRGVPRIPLIVCYVLEVCQAWNCSIAERSGLTSGEDTPARPIEEQFGEGKMPFLLSEPVSQLQPPPQKLPWWLLFTEAIARLSPHQL